MKRIGCILLFSALFSGLALGRGPARVRVEVGKQWLNGHAEPAAVNVAGDWQERAWGKVKLIQAEGSKVVTGTGDGWDIDGIVSGKKVFLIFSSRGRIEYTAELTADAANALNGSYASGLGLEGSKTRPMNLTK